MEFRLLKADEIDVRVAQVKESGCSLLLYKDARVDMNILDTTIGLGNWQRRHYECKGNLFCSVGIRLAMNGYGRTMRVQKVKLKKKKAKPLTALSGLV